MSFLDQASSAVAKHNGRIYATWYDVHGNPTDEYTYGKLWNDAGAIAYHLRNTWNVKKGEKVVLCYTFGLHFFAAFLGCLRAGVVAVLVFPPAPPLEKSLPKLAKVVEDCKPAVILTNSTIAMFKRIDQLNPVSASRTLWPSGIRYMKTDSLLKQKQNNNISLDDDSICAEDLAFLQYTSGSTSLPKAVMVTHRNIAANVQLWMNGMKKARPGDTTGNFVGFSWLPQYHDLGLIYASIGPFAAGYTMHMMSPISFIKNPLLWIRLVSEKRVEWSAAPNFAYRLVSRRFLEAKARSPNEHPLPGLDLSCVHHFLNCAEPVALETHQEFADCFRHYGLPQNWFAAGFGLAENVVACTFNHGYKLSTQRLEDSSQFIAVGHLDNLDPSIGLKIVDPQSRREVAVGITGELWISGPSKTAGYLGKPELSEEVMQAKLHGSTLDGETYLRTGDLAFFQDDYLFICGRIKDLIIVNGVNYYPHDLEYAAQSIPGVRPGCVAAFSPGETADGDGQVQIVFEVRKEHVKEAAAICVEIREVITRRLGLTPTFIAAIKERTIAKTTSGKIQRRKTRQMIHDDLFQVIFSLGNSGRSKKGSSTSSSEDSTELSAESDSDIFSRLPPNEKYDKMVAKVLGEAYNPLATWADGGLSSMAMVELTNLLSEHFPVTIPPDFPDKYRTPNALKEFVLSPSSGAFFPVELVNLKQCQEEPRMLRFRGFFPPQSKELKCLVPLTLPLWHLSYSMMVLLSKWIVIGKYSSRQVVVPSGYFLRWWFVDRLVHMWEFFTGRFLLNTPFLWLFYRMMGTKIAPSVEVDAFIREFDLVTIEQSATIESNIGCRMFGPWEKSKDGNGADLGGAPSLRFRPVFVASGCKIRGHVALGAYIGVGSCVERLTSVPEGAKVPAGVIAVGSPAYQSPDPSQSNITSSWFHTLGAAKIMFIMVELYMSAGFFLAAEAGFGRIVRSWTWRYATLVRLVLLIAVSSMIGLLASVPIKWALVGRRRSGSSKSDLQTLLYWIADYHFGIYISLFNIVAENTVMVNVLLMAMGMDIDLASKVWLFILPPSKVDLISVKRSFVSAATFDVMQTGKAEPITIQDSSVGHSTYFAGGTAVRHTEIIPFSRVTEDVLGDAKKWESQKSLPTISGRLLVDLAVIPVVVMMTVSLIPTYEFVQSDLLGSLVPALGFPVLQVALGLFVHGLTWYFVCVLLHRAVYLGSRNGKGGHSAPWSNALFAVYMQLMCEFWELSFFAISWGTPFVNAALVGLGVEINDGPVWYFGRRFYDAPMIVVNGRTIVDSSWVNGHFVVNGKIEFGKCVISGVLHEGTVCLAHTHMQSSNGQGEVGPIHFVSPKRGEGLHRMAEDYDV